MSKFEIVSGVEGKCLYIDETRVAGPKPWGGGTIVDAFTTDERYVPERTCRNTGEQLHNFNEMGFFECSICGSTTKLDWDWHGDLGDLKYCANCGAKVVE